MIPLNKKVETIYDEWERISKDYYRKEDVDEAIKELKLRIASADAYEIIDEIFGDVIVEKGEDKE